MRTWASCRPELGFDKCRNVHFISYLLGTSCQSVGAPPCRPSGVSSWTCLPTRCPTWFNLSRLDDGLEAPTHRIVLGYSMGYLASSLVCLKLSLESHHAHPTVHLNSFSCWWRRKLRDAPGHNSLRPDNVAPDFLCNDDREGWRQTKHRPLEMARPRCSVYTKRDGPLVNLFTQPKAECVRSMTP
ncbi:uncharacterized protein B0H64DRAFT_405748 [Chaetomium fimeti]|uniref:Uncharacterized protein n=1 Tax=Chaetomium fimeti TaxID=1854472 RepID=A0AAE0H8X4_9PEZI|nr:hypothetical protein B0H64DRAFT_405748 [Chaetomium fimeti]